MVAYRHRLSEMIWLDRALCVTINRHAAGSCAHEPKDLGRFGIRIKRCDMFSNGPTCTTKRWWIYTRRGAFVIDVDSMFFPKGRKRPVHCTVEQPGSSLGS